MWFKLALTAFLGFFATFGNAQNLAEVAAANNLNTLLTAAQATGQDAALTAPGELTVFAPTDEAFAALPAGALQYLLQPDNIQALSLILGFHVVQGTVLSSDLTDGGTAMTLTQETLTFTATDTGFAVEDANIVTPDLTASNGVIHIIDKVLIPPGIEFPADIVDLAVSTGQFPTLVTAVTEAGLVDALKSDIFTVFAPSENAFAALPAGALGFLLRNLDLLQQVLLYHVLSGVVMSGDITDGMMAETLSMANLTFAVAEDGTVTINDSANVVAADIVALNGVIHVINSVLLPPDITLPPGIAEIGIAAGKFNTLFTAIQAVGLESALAVEGPLTVFAPTDMAFEGVDVNALLTQPATLIGILTYHVVEGQFTSDDLEDGMVLTTLAQQPIYISVSADGAVTINDSAMVTDPDLIGINGVIHGISSVLTPGFMPGDTPAPVEAMTPAPVDTTTPAPVVSSTPAPVTPEPTPAPVETDAPTEESGASTLAFMLGLTIAVGIAAF